MTVDTNAQETDYQFTNSWFVGNIPVWQQILDRNKPKKILEIGSFEGRSTCFLIEVCTKNSDDSIDVTCIDTWQGGIEHQKGGGVEASMSDVEQRFDHNIALVQSRVAHRAKVRKLKKLSYEGLSELMANGGVGTFDFVYIDGSHQAPDVLTDAVMSFYLLKPQGIMIFDDYLWSMDRPGFQDVLKMPKPAIDAFMNIFQRKMVVFSGAPIGQLYCRKISD